MFYHVFKIWLKAWYNNQNYDNAFKNWLLYTARRENLYTFIIVFISEFVQIFTPRPVLRVFEVVVKHYEYEIIIQFNR